MHAPLDRAAVLAARHDLLARVAALLEVDAADQFEVDHLRHELLDRGRRDARHAARTSSQRHACGVQRRQRGRLPPAGCTSSERGICPRRRAGGSTTASPCWRAAPRPARRRPSRRGRGPASPNSRPLGAGIVELALGAQHEHRQALAHGAASVGAAQQAELVGAHAPDDEAGQQAALGRAVAGQARLARRASRRRPASAGRAGRSAASAPRARISPSRSNARRRRMRWSVQGCRPCADYHQRPWASLRQGLGASRRNARHEVAALAACSCCCWPPAARRLGRGAGSTSRCRWPRRPSSCRSNPAPRRARSPRPGCAPACRRRRCCCTNGSAGPARRGASAPAATRSAPDVTPRQLLDKMVHGDESLETRAPDRGLDAAPVARRAGARRRT